MPASEDKDVAFSPKSLDESSKNEAPMTDATLATEILQEAFPVSASRNVKAAIGEAFQALKGRERHLAQSNPEVLRERPRAWTERRVRSIWNGKEAKRIDHYEIEDLRAIARKEAALELQRSKARQARLAALLADPAPHRGRQLAHLVRERVGGMDRAGADGAD